MKLRSSFCRTQTAIDALYVHNIKKLIEMLISLSNITLVANSVFCICCCIWKMCSYGICARGINVYEYSTESFGLARTGRVNSVDPVKLHFKPQLLLVPVICATSLVLSVLPTECCMYERVVYDCNDK